MGKPDQKGGGKKGSGKRDSDDAPLDAKGKAKAKGKGKGFDGIASGKDGGKGGKDMSKGNPSYHPKRAEENDWGDETAPIVREKTQGKEKKSRSKKVEEEREKDFLYAQGTKCKVRKHTEIGCAVVTMESQGARDYILAHAEKTVPKEGKESRPFINIKDKVLQMRPYVDKDAQEHVLVDIFVAWGRQAEKLAPLLASTVADAIDCLVEAAGDGIDDFVAPAGAVVVPSMPLKASATAPPPPPPITPATNDGAVQSTSQTPQTPTLQQYAAAQMVLAQQMAAAQMAQQFVAQQQMMQMMAAMTNGDASGYEASATASATSAPRQEQKKNAFKIVDPGNGEEIPSSASGMRLGAKAFVPSVADAGVVDAGHATVWERKTLKIVDPRNGEAIAGISASGMRVDAREFVPPSAEDTTAAEGGALEQADFKPAVEKKAFKIMDPRSGVAVEAPAKN